MTDLPADPMRGLVLFLKDRIPDLAARISRPELPPNDDPSMPSQTIVVRPAGGYQLFGATNAPIGDPHLDLYCWGSTWLEAEMLARRTIPILRQLRTTTWGGVRLYWALIAGGPNPYEDPETNWPCSVLTAQVAYCELQVA